MKIIRDFFCIRIQKALSAAFLAIFLPNAFAIPSQIDVIGIIPGVSTFKETIEKTYKRSNDVYLIGGFAIECIFRIRGSIFTGTDRIDKFYCPFGSSTDISSPNRPIIVSAENVFEKLAKGFTEKFGLVLPELKKACSAGDYIVNCLAWVDSKGNILMLFLMKNPGEGQNFSGRLELKSRALVIEEADKKVREALESEDNRRF